MPYTTRSKTKSANGESSTAQVATKRIAESSEDDQSDFGGDDGNESYESIDERPKKRQTKAVSKGTGKSSRSGQPVKKRRVAGKLSVLPSMPIDILFEIFGHLEPVDLVRLSRTSKAFRQVLLSQESTFLWRDTFANSGGAPPCPEDVTELAWANLLFGGTYCQGCGAKSVRKILFELRMRLCQKCISSRMSVGYDFEGLFTQDYHRELCQRIMRALPSSMARTKAGSYSYTATIYNPEDIKSVLSELDELFTSSGASFNEAAVKFLDEREEKLKPLVQHARICHDWESERDIARSYELADVRQNRRDKIIEKIKSLGYEQSDANGIWRVKDISVARPLTDRAWDRLFLTIKDSLDEMKRLRLERRKQEMKLERRRQAVKAYYKHLKTLPPMDAPFWPALEQCLQFSPLSKLVEVDASDITSQWQEELEKGAAEAFLLVRNKISEHKRYLVSTLPREDSLAANSVEELSEADLDSKLAQATAIFRDSDFSWSPPPNFGLEVLMMPHEMRMSSSGSTMHYHYGLRPSTTFWNTGYEAVLHVLSRLQRDKTTTTADLDAAGDRLICLTCGTRIVYTWREAVLHASKGHANQDGKLSSDCNLRTLMPGERRQMELLEHTRYRMYNEWGCCHCNVQLDCELPRYSSRLVESWKPLDAIQIHLSDKHDISEPNHGRDYFRNRGVSWEKWRQSVCLPEPY